MGEQEMKAEEGEYRLRDSAEALLFEDDAKPDVYVGMDTNPVYAPLLPMHTAVPPPPLGELRAVAPQVPCG